MRRHRDEPHPWCRVVVTSGLLFLAAVVPAKRRETPQPPPYSVDKVAHGLGHASVARALFDALTTENSPSSRRWAALTAVVVSTGYGLGLELCQRWIPGRRFERGDVLAGAFESVVGVGVAWLEADGCRWP